MSKRAVIGVVVLGIIAMVLISTYYEKRIENYEGKIDKQSHPKTFRFGVILPLSGQGAIYGRNARNGIELALEDLERMIGGRLVKVYYEDSKGEPKTAVSAFHKLVEIDDVRIIIGPLASSTLLAVAPLANEQNIVLLSPTASSPKVTGAGDYIFRNVASDAVEAKTIARFAFENLGYRKIGILYIQNDFGEGHKSTFKNTFKEMGGQIIATSGYLANETSFRTHLLALQKGAPEAIYLVGGKEMGQVLRQSTELALNLRFLSFSMFEDPEIVRMAGKAAEGIYYSLQTFDPASAQEPMRSFATRYKEKYGTLPDPFASLSYDAIQILSVAVGKPRFESDEIKQSLYAIRNFSGVTGKTTFDTNGDVTKPISIKQYKNGQFQWVDRYDN